MRSRVVELDIDGRTLWCRVWIVGRVGLALTSEGELRPIRWSYEHQEWLAGLAVEPPKGEP